MAEIRSEAAKHHWRIFTNQIPFSRGFPKMMRGDCCGGGSPPSALVLSCAIAWVGWFLESRAPGVAARLESMGGAP